MIWGYLDLLMIKTKHVACKLQEGLPKTAWDLGMAICTLLIQTRWHPKPPCCNCRGASQDSLCRKHCQLLVPFTIAGAPELKKQIEPGDSPDSATSMTQFPGSITVQTNSNEPGIILWQFSTAIENHRFFMVAMFVITRGLNTIKSQ